MLRVLQPGMKRRSSQAPVSRALAKKPRLPSTDNARKRSRIASAEDAALVDASPPYQELLLHLETKRVQESVQGGCIVYWMRMEDLRSAHE